MTELSHSALAELAGRSYRGPQSATVALDVQISLVPREDELVVVFPGTHPRDALDWIRDLRAWPRWFDGLGYVHSGFGSGSIAAWRAEAFNLRKTGLVSIIGHSLGGTLAQGFGALFAQYRAGQPFRVVTFGAPRLCLIGNGEVRRALGCHLTEYARAGDIVPHVPLRPIYQHPSDPIVIGKSTRDFVTSHSIALYQADLAAMGR